MRRLAALLVLTANAYAYCPSYTLSSASNDHMCGVEAAPGTNPTAAEWHPIFALVTAGPAFWPAGTGPNIADVKIGCATPQAYTAAAFPCELVKAIMMNESGWKQFCVPESPPDQVGKTSRTIISFDCGYGIAQVTSGMHIGENPAYDRMKVAGDPTYNLATGMQILVQKWNATRCIGARQPRTIEHWYHATWAYNGLAEKNNPSNPNYDPMRSVCNPNVGCPNRPYQERVFGWVEYPPSAAHWTKTALAYPDRGDIPFMTGLQSPPALGEPDCAGPTDCVNKRTTHETGCVPPTMMMEAPASDGGIVADDLAVEPAPEQDLAMRDKGMYENPNVGVQPGGCSCDLARGSSATGAPLLLILLALFVRRRASHH